MCFSQSVTFFCIKGRSGFVAARHLYDIPVVLFEMVARGEIEPPTRGFSVRCRNSANQLIILTFQYTILPIKFVVIAVLGLVLHAYKLRVLEARAAATTALRFGVAGNYSDVVEESDYEYLQTTELYMSPNELRCPAEKDQEKRKGATSMDVSGQAGRRRSQRRLVNYALTRTGN